MSYRLPMHQRMANALSYGEFRIFYQPVVELQTGKVVGLEALCRWPQRDDTWAPPEMFISQAETSGFIVQLGDWVLRTAVEQVRKWQTRFGIDLLLAVNLSGRQFLHYNLIKSIEDAMRSVQYHPKTLEFEITESVAMHNAEDSIGIMRQLKSIGIALALDDFGTGYSSLAYLKRFPIDKLKIDRAFVRDIPDDANDLAIVSAIIAMAHALGLKVQAEGVETEAQMEFLRDCGCEYAQGYLFGRALPGDEFEELLADQRAAKRTAS
ncbi:MAG TPA: EAL domain-containing protein [Candidatus Baltobacteraceae bacterium]|nr:EAL domain-containing protein [Candidatus Baltobacteraceae bacterium]